MPFVVILKKLFILAKLLIKRNMKKNYILLLLLFTIPLCYIFAQTPSGYYFISNFANPANMTNNDPVPGIISYEMQATSANSLFWVESDFQFNEWSNSSVNFNEEFVLTWSTGDGLNSPSTLNTSATLGNYYTLQIEGLEYSNRNAVIMETTDAPVGFDTAIAPQQLPSTNISPGAIVFVDATLENARNTELKMFVRFSDDGFTTSVVEELSVNRGDKLFLGAIPGSFNTAGKTVEYYFFTTTLDASSITHANADLVSIDMLNNGGANYKYTVNHTTEEDGPWNNGFTWTSGSVPPTDVPTEINNTISVSVDLDISGDITINPTKALLITPGKSLKFSGNTIKADGLLGMFSSSTLYPSLILDSASTITGSGYVEYQRHVNGIDGGNDLVSPPLAGITFQGLTIINSSTLASADSGSGNTAYAFAYFDVANGGTGNGSNGYVNLVSPLDNLTVLAPGRGYRAATTGTGGNLTFKSSNTIYNETFDPNPNLGVLNSDVTIPIFNNGETNYKSWNLIGNPYSSYLSAEAEELINLNQLDTGFGALYMYNAGTAGSGTTSAGSYPGATLQGNYAVLSVSYLIDPQNADTGIAPGQGFFVKAKTGGGSFLFKQAWRKTAIEVKSPDDAISGKTATNLSLTNENFAKTKLQLTQGASLNEIDIYFTDTTTRGLDPGYDVGGFGGNTSGMFTHLLEDNAGTQMAVQSLPYSDINDVVIPLGIKANAGEQFTLSLNDTYTVLPTEINVYLEDNVLNTVTLLNDGDYTLSPSTTLNGTGRYFIRFQSEALSHQDSSFSTIQIYTPKDSKTLVVKGNLQSDTQLLVYDIQGRVMLQSSLDTSVLTNTIYTERLNTGVYIVQLTNATQSKTQKIIIK